MIELTIRSFAMIRETLGQKRIELRINKKSSLDDVLDQLIKLSPEARIHLKSEGGKINPDLVFAINGDAIPGNKLNKIEFEDGDVLAILPPAGGG